MKGQITLWRPVVKAAFYRVMCLSYHTDTFFGGFTATNCSIDTLGGLFVSENYFLAEGKCQLPFCLKIRNVKSRS